MSLIYDNAVVYGPAAAPLVYTVLDLSAFTGAAERRVKLKCTCVAPLNYIAFKPGAGSGVDPHPEDWHEFAGCGRGATEAYSRGGGYLTVTLEVMTDDLGHVRWISNAANNWTITLIGHWDEASVWTHVFTGAGPGAWTNLNLGTPGANLCWLKVRRNDAGPAHWLVRPDGEVDGTITDAGSVQLITAGRSVGSSVMSVASIVEQYAFTPGNYDIWLGTYSTGWVDARAHASNPIFPLAAAPVALTLLDLSPIVGVRRVNALLRVKLAAGPFREQVRFAPFDDAGVASYVYGDGNVGTGDAYSFGLSAAWPYGFAPGWCCFAEVTTDASGRIWWQSDAGDPVEVQVEGYEPFGGGGVPPVVTGTGPTGAAVSPNASITFTTTDDVQVELSTLGLTLTDPLGVVRSALVNGLWQSGYGGTITANAGNGYDVVCSIHPIMISRAWSATAYCEDAGGLSDTDTWSWTIPYNPNLDPRAGALLFTQLRGRYVSGPNTVTPNYGTLGGEILLGDGTTPATFPTQAIGPRGMTLNGSSSYLQLAAPASGLSFGNGTTDFPFSVSLSVFGNSFTVFKGTWAAPEWGVLTSAGAVYVYCFTSAAIWFGRGYTTALPVASTTHVVATYDGSRSLGGLLLYTDGVRRALSSWSAGAYVAMSALGGACTVGYISGIGYYGSTLYDLRVYPFELTPGQVAYLAGRAIQERWH